MQIKEIKIEDFDYPLPDERIARHPLQKRDACRMLFSDDGGNISHRHFHELPELLKADTLIVANETKVINARIEFFKETGSRIEIFLLEPLSPEDYALNFASDGPCTWSCMVGNRKRWKSGRLIKEITVRGLEKPVKFTASLGNELPGNSWEVTFDWDAPGVSFATMVEEAGEIPIPPYLNRKSEASDTDDYQTVYSRIEGSVAAPTAGLHFTPEVMERLREKGIDFARVLLHVGAGTFQPVKSETIGDHPMHRESIIISRELVERLLAALENGEEILAVGTTTVRTLESLPYLGLKLRDGKLSADEITVDQWMPYDDAYKDLNVTEALKWILDYFNRSDTDQLQTSTSIMIAPGFKWRLVGHLITNFHQPKSTLLLLVSSFLNPTGSDSEQWKKIYNEALGNEYRFLSYGDACLLQPLKSQK